MEIKDFLRANGDRVAAVALVVLGAVALIVGWFGVSRTGIAAEQNPYIISAGVGGIALIAVGCTLWLSADLQDEWRRLDSLEEHLRTLVSNQTRGSAEGRHNGVAANPSENGVGDDATVESSTRSSSSQRARRTRQPTS